MFKKRLTGTSTVLPEYLNRCCVCVCVCVGTNVIKTCYIDLVGTVILVPTKIRESNQKTKYAKIWLLMLKVRAG